MVGMLRLVLGLEGSAGLPSVFARGYCLSRGEEDLFMPRVLEEFFPWAVAGVVLVLIIVDIAFIWVLF